MPKEAKSLIGQVEAAGERIAELESDLQTATATANELADRVTTLEAEAQAAEDRHTEEAAELQQSVAELTAKVAELQAERDQIQAALTAAEQTMRIAPFEDTSTGTDPVPEGNAASDPVDYRAELARIQRDKGAKAAIAYYREHEQEIDSAQRR